MAVPSSVIEHAFTEAFQYNAKVLKRTGEITGETPFKATVAFETSDGDVICVKWSTSYGYEYLG